LQARQDIFLSLTTGSKVNATIFVLDYHLPPDPSPPPSREATIFQLRSTNEVEGEILTL